MGSFCKLNQIYVEKETILGQKISRGSYFVREEKWSIDEMSDILIEVLKKL